MDSQSFKYDPFLKNNRNTLSVTIILICKQHSLLGCHHHYHCYVFVHVFFLVILKQNALQGKGQLKGGEKM